MLVKGLPGDMFCFPRSKTSFNWCPLCYWYCHQAWLLHYHVTYSKTGNAIVWSFVGVRYCLRDNHYRDIIMGAMASPITSLTIVYSTVYSGADQRKHRSSASLVIGEFLAQMASNAKNVSIWWRHHAVSPFTCWPEFKKHKNVLSFSIISQYVYP